MRWSELDETGTILLIPPERMKNKRAHILPLTARMQKLLASLPRFDSGEYVFSTTYGSRPISGFSKYEAKLDRQASAIGDVNPWQIHDIRRTTRTNLSRAGVPVFDAELIIAHQQSGVHGTYDKFRYIDEKLAGLLKWEKLLATIIAPPPGNVVPLSASGRLEADETQRKEATQRRARGATLQELART